MNKLESIFKTKRPLIGMVHFPPLVGYPDYPGFEYIARKMVREARILEKSGFDGIIIENNYDTPHKEKISSSSASMFASLARLLQQEIKIPFGISVLWNDFDTALAICASTSAKFFRVPAFVDSVKTAYGIMPARANEVIKLRKKLNLNRIAVFADIQVKHSEMIDKEKTLKRSAMEALKKGADAVIVTGKWTGDRPKADDLKDVRMTIGNFPILIGSGASIKNLSKLAQDADGVIVGTAIKEGRAQSEEVNLKPYDSKISFAKAINFVKEFKRTFK